MTAEIIRDFVDRRVAQLDAAKDAKAHKAKMQRIADGMRPARRARPD